MAGRRGRISTAGSASFFTFQTKANGDAIVPLCAPYANGNCVVYSVFFQNPGQEPDPSMYVGPVNWNITYNNGTFVPPAPWTGSTPRLYYDPSGFVVPNSPYGTDCTTPMLIGSPGVPTSPAIFCQFVFDITTIFDASKKVDPLIGGKTKVFSDAIVAFPPNFAPVVTVTTTPDAATVTAGSPIGFTITVSNSAVAVGEQCFTEHAVARRNECELDDQSGLRGTGHVRHYGSARQPGAELRVWHAEPERKREPAHPERFIGGRDGDQPQHG